MQDVPCAVFDVTDVIRSLKTSMRRQWHGLIKHYHPSQPATSAAPCNTEALILQQHSDLFYVMLT